MLIDAGANVDSRNPKGVTPLFCAAACGHVGAVMELLRRKTDPLLGRMEQPGKIQVLLPLDGAACFEKIEVVRELLQQLGLEGCGGQSGGVDALVVAGCSGHVGILALLTDAGVVDTGVALHQAAGKGEHAAVDFLLRQKEGDTTYGDCFFAPAGVLVLGSALISCILCGCAGAPRITRVLVDAARDTTSAVRITTEDGMLFLHDTPMNAVRLSLHGGEQALLNQHQRNRVGAIRRLLLQVEAVHATSWLWNDIPLAMLRPMRIDPLQPP